MATMTFEVKFIWHGSKPNIFKRKMYEAEYARVNNWLKQHTNGQAVTVPELTKLVDAYQLVYPNLVLNYSMSNLGELIGTTPNDATTFVTFELGNSI